MFTQIKFQEDQLNNIFELLNNTYGYDYNIDKLSFNKKVKLLSKLYDNQDKKHLMKSENGSADLQLPADWNGTLFLSDISVNIKIEQLGSKLGVDSFKLNKLNKEEPGFIMIENQLEESVPFLIMII